jgi:hypothetical protein
METGWPGEPDAREAVIFHERRSESDLEKRYLEEIEQIF